MKTTVIFALFLANVFHGITAGFAVALPERGAPILFPYAEFPIAKWKSLSVTNFPWFVETTNGWYINWDCEAEPLENLIVHHTATSQMETPEWLSKLMLERLYAPVYKDPKPKNPYVFGLPMHSAHVIGGVETFTAYHFLIYQSGEVRTTLIPHKQVGEKWYVDMIGWGAGKWDINCSSVQVALVGDYGAIPPSKEALQTLTSLIEHYRKLVPSIAVRSHREVRPQPTDCPGAWFEGWRKALLIP